MVMVTRKRLAELEEMERKIKDISLSSENKVGYFNNVNTWSEAIELLIKANCDDGDGGYRGSFVEIDGDIYFRLGMENVDDWKFSKGRLLLTEEGSKYEGMKEVE